MLGKKIKLFFLLSVLILIPFSLFAETKPEKATFAGGCFWCMEQPFEKLEGVSEVLSGYTGGHKENPTYEEVSSGATSHLEAIQITYDPAKISYSELLDLFWKQIDPTDPGGQFADRGLQYRTAIFYHNEAQREAAQKSLEALKRDKPFKEAVVTELVAATQFYPAEDYHQDYYLKNPLRYKIYRFSCGRDQRLEVLWGGK